MRYGILGDIHGNLEALEAAIGALADRGVQRYLQVGDVVGYGADPSACIRILSDIGATVVAGNHDWAVIGKLDTSCFNFAARAAVEWTRQVLVPSERQYLESLPLIEVVDGCVTLAHATPDQPELFDYILSYYDAHRALECFETNLGFIGHSHVPVTFLLGDEVGHTEEPSFSVEGWKRVLVNVGSVGQPRDEDPRCACAVYDDERATIELVREIYDVETAAAKIVAAGLPRVLADRLFLGR